MRKLQLLLIILGGLYIAGCTSFVRHAAPPETAPPPEETDPFADAVMPESFTEEDVADTLSEAVTDEEVIYKFSLAEEYYAFGVAANLKKNWAEAQYDFEKAIEILTSLDLGFDSASVESEILERSYRRLMNEITSDYKLALFNLSVLADETSPYALDEKFRLLDSLSGFSGEQVVTEPTIGQPVTYDMPIEINERVTRWIIYFQTAARKFTQQTLARSNMYVPIMRKILEEEGLPSDLVYLPFIESGYKDRAYSYAHAAGFWQFISSTARLWGLKRTWWYDERYDFEKATRAAARYLKHLYEEHGDWRLALTAYNGGSGNVNKLKRNNGNKDYWDWKIKNSQMRNFVPKYMAAVIIAKQPERYGFDVSYGEPLEWEEVSIDRPVYLSDVASATGVSVAKIRELNPAILRDYTPPNMDGFRLRVPKGKSGALYAAYAGMKSPQETSWVRHRVGAGETVSTIARKYGVSQSAIIQANNLRRPYRIIAGRTLVVPVPMGQGGNASYSEESYELTGNYYIVRRGDNLSNIARAFGTTAEALQEANDLRSKHQIKVGQRLKIPGRLSAGQSADEEYAIYTVRKGDNLSSIARNFGTSVTFLCRLNNISSRSTLTIGQKLKVPGKQGDESAPRTSAVDHSRTEIYTVKKGENLAVISAKYGMSIRNLARLNGLSETEKLRIGQKLRVNVPAGTANQGGHKTYVVRKGDTVWGIARMFNTSADRILSLNDQVDPQSLKVGARLRISAD